MRPQSKNKGYNKMKLPATPFQAFYLMPYNRYHNRVIAILSEFTGPVSFQEMEHAWMQLVQRHDGLRVSFQMEGKQLFQIFNKHIDFKINYSFKPAPNDLQDAVNNYCQPIDLENPPLFRITVYYHEKECYRILYEFHHAICDGVALSILFKELVFLLTKMPLNTAPSCYEYTLFLNEYANSEAYLQDITYWQKKLFDVKFNISETTSVKEGLNGSEQMDLPFKLDEAMMEEITKFTDKNKISNYAFFLGAFNLTLAEFFGQEDIVYATVVTQRNNKKFENIVANLANHILIRMVIFPNESTIDFLKRVYLEVSFSMSHMNFPFIEVMKMIKPWVPVERITLIYHHTVKNFSATDMREKIKINNLVVSFLGGKALGATRDLLLTITEQAKNFAGILTYRKSVYQDKQMSDFLKRFLETVDIILGRSKN